MKLLARLNILVFLGLAILFIFSEEVFPFALLHIIAAVLSLSVGYKKSPYWIYLVSMIAYFGLSVFYTPTSRIAIFNPEGTIGLSDEIWTVIGLFYAFISNTLYFFYANAQRLKYKGAIKY